MNMQEDLDQARRQRDYMLQHVGKCWFDYDSFMRACDRFTCPLEQEIGPVTVPAQPRHAAWQLAFWASGLHWDGPTRFPLVRRANKWAWEHEPPLPEAYGAPEALQDEEVTF